MADYQYQQILNMYTQMIPFSRYDVLLYELGRLKLTDIKGESHVLNKFYRSYNTYRKDIGPDVSTLKINETYNDQDSIEKNYFNLNSLDTSYVFDGIVLSKKFATNGNEMSLEDLFAEFYYEYLTAVDSSYLYSPEYGQTYYFNQSYVDPATQEEVVGGTYRILPVGSIYKDDDGIVSNVDYDGTYVPTIGELLSGTLYLVIQSEGKPARKIMFNHHNLPTLFINDDKYYTTDEYIMNNNQLLRLCDVKLYSRLGVRIAWEDIAYLDGKSVADMLAKIGNNEHNLWVNNQIGPNEAFFRIYYRAQFENSASPTGETTVFISGRKDIKVGTNPANAKLSFGEGFVDQPDNDSWTWKTGQHLSTYEYDPEYFLKNQDKSFLYRTTGYIPASNIETHTIRLHIRFGVSLILKGYTLVEESPDTYDLQWYKYTAEPTTFSGSISVVNNLVNDTLSSVQMNFSPALQLTVGSSLSPGGTRSYNYTIPDSSKGVSYTLQNLVVSASGRTLTENTDYTYTFNKTPWVPQNAQNSGVLTINTPAGSRTVNYFFWNDVTVNGSHITINSCSVKFNNDTITLSGTNNNHYHNYQHSQGYSLAGSIDSLAWSTLVIEYTLDSDVSGTVINETVTDGQTGDTNKTYAQIEFIDSSDWGSSNPTPTPSPSVWTTEFLSDHILRIHIIAKPFHLT